LYIEPDALALQKQDCRVIPGGEMLRTMILGMFDVPSHSSGETRAVLIVPMIQKKRERTVRPGLSSRDGS
jgi:hypothetical protein